MDMHTEASAVNEEQSQVEATDDSRNFIDPLVKNTVSFYTTECVSGDWSAEVKQENVIVVKQEPGDVCYVLFPMFNSTQ